MFDSRSASPVEEFVKTVSMAYSADDEKEEDEFADTPPASTADGEDEVAADAWVSSALDEEDELVDDTHSASDALLVARGVGAKEEELRSGLIDPTPAKGTL